MFSKANFWSVANLCMSPLTVDSSLPPSTRVFRGIGPTMAKFGCLLRATATTRSAYLVMGCLRRKITMEWPPSQTHAEQTHIWWTTLRAQSYIRTADHVCRNSLERSRAWCTNDALNISSSKTLVAIRVVHSSTTLSFAYVHVSRV